MAVRALVPPPVVMIATTGTCSIPKYMHLVTWPEKEQRLWIEGEIYSTDKAVKTCHQHEEREVQREEKPELIMEHVRSKKYFMFSSVKQLCDRTWNPLSNFKCSVWKSLTQSSKNLEEVLPFIWIRLLSDQKISVLSHNFHVGSNNFSFPEVWCNYWTVILQVILEMSWLIDLRAQASSEPLKPEAGDIIPF